MINHHHRNTHPQMRLFAGAFTFLLVNMLILFYSENVRAVEIQSVD